MCAVQFPETGQAHMGLNGQAVRTSSDTQFDDSD